MYILCIYILHDDVVDVKRVVNKDERTIRA